MKLAYVTTYDPLDPTQFSGSGSYIYRSLGEAGFDLLPIANLKKTNIWFWLLKRSFYAYVGQRRYYYDREPTLLKGFAAQVDKVLTQYDCDVVFSPGTIPLAYLQTDKPLVFWTDATFAGMIDFYPSFSNLVGSYVDDGNTAEQLALSKCRLAIFSSQWAADSALQLYDVDPGKVAVVPFGANIECDRSLADIEAIVRRRDFDTCRLLFVGVEWTRKGGDVAVRVCECLNRRGVKTELDVVGCAQRDRLPSFVKQHGFVSKQTKDGRELLDRLMRESHFLILPSKAECCAVVLAEASSFGLPALATRVGGIPTAVRDGKNGQTFGLDDSPESYCEYIEELIGSVGEYRELCLTSYHEYATRLNWRSAAQRVHELILDSCCK